MKVLFLLLFKKAMSHEPGHGFFLLILLIYQLQVIEPGNTPTIRQVERRHRWVGPIAFVREVGPNCFVHRMERLRPVHQREGGNIGQVDLDQVRVDFLQLGPDRFPLGSPRSRHRPQDCCTDPSCRSSCWPCPPIQSSADFGSVPRAAWGRRRHSTS